RERRGVLAGSPFVRHGEAVEEVAGEELRLPRERRAIDGRARPLLDELHDRLRVEREDDGDRGRARGRLVLAVGPAVGRRGAGRDERRDEREEGREARRTGAWGAHGARA